MELIEYNALSNLTQEISILQILIMFVHAYGVIDDLYQKNVCFSKLKFFSMRCIRLSTVVYDILYTILYAESWYLRPLPSDSSPLHHRQLAERV